MKRHSPTDPRFEHALTGVTFPMHEAVRKMDSQEPTYLGTLFPAHMQMHSADHSQQGPETTSQTNSFTVPLLDKFNTTIINLIFNVVTLINALVHCCLLISARLSTRNGGWLTKFVVGVVQATLTQKTVQALELLTPTPHPRSLLDLDIDELENVLKTSTPSPNSKPSLFIAPALLSMLKGFAILGAVFLTAFILWLILRYLILPLTYKSNICRQLCVGYTTDNQTFRQPPITDLFLDIVHVHSGTQIRIYLTTISAPACALSFTGSVLLKNFKVDRRKLQLLVHIDWHNCLLLYNNFIIPLPDTGTALFFQPNLLTDFTHRGPYNIVLLARHLDQLIQIPHLDQTDTLPSVERVERLDFPLKSPYQKVHDEVKALMPLAKSVASSTDSESSQPIHVV